jgi:glycosyltransferase involved in cell wall biosynthesis
MRRILFFSHFPTYAGLDGGNKILLVTAKGLSSDKYEKLVITPGQGALSNELRAAGIREQTSYYDCGRFNGMVFSILQNYEFEEACRHIEDSLRNEELFRFICEWKPDIVYANTTMAINGAILGKMAGAKVIWHIHDIVTNYLGEQDRMNLGRLINHYADKVVYVSKAVGDSLPDLCGKEKCELIYIGVDNPRIGKKQFSKKRYKARSRLGIAPSQPVAVFLGQITPVKGVDHFVIAAHNILKQLPNARFLIIGDPKRDAGYTRTLKETILHLRRMKEITFYGYCSDLTQVLPAADCLVVPSRFQDPLPAVLIEANLYHVPVAAYRCGGIPEAVIHGENGYLVTQNDIQSLAGAMYRIMKDPGSKRKMGRFGYRRAVSKFSYYRYIKNMEDIFDETADGKTGSRLRDGQLARGNDSVLWYIHRGQRHHISPNMLPFIGLHADDIMDASGQGVERIPEGNNFDTMIKGVVP